MAKLRRTHGPVKPKGGRTNPPAALSLAEALQQHRFNEGVCFLCGTELHGHSHNEDVFPKWLQRRFNTANKKLTLLNGSTIPYRLLKVPCCKRCNNEDLSRVENKVKRAVDLGISGVRKLDRLTLFLWVAKLFFGILYKELQLPLDRAKGDGERIVEHLQGFELLHYFIQALRVPMTFHSADSVPFPGTLFLFKIQKLENRDMQFDFRDDVLHRTVFIRMGDIGILVAFDAGAQAIGARDAYRRPMRCNLHPIQFEELGAHLFYDAQRFNRSPAVITASGGPNSRAFVMVGPIGGLRDTPVFNASDPAEYAKMLSFFTGVDYKILHPSPKQIMTFLYNEKGRFRRLPLKHYDYRGYQ